MSEIFNPIHVTEIGGKTLRFFKGPTSAPDLPWHAVDDLFVVCGFNREMRRHFLRSAQRTFGEDLRTIATESGPTTIAPHAAAQALLAAAAHVRFELKQTEEAYTHAAAAALGALAGDLPPEAKFKFLVAAARNSGIGGDQ